MTDWTALSIGASEEVDDEGSRVKVQRAKDGVYVIRRFFDGSWQDAAWVRQVDVGWGISRELGTFGTPAEDLSAAITEGIVRSREAIRRAPSSSSE